VKSPNPAFANVDVPLASTFMLSTKPGKEVYVEPVIENGGYRFTVKLGKPKNVETAKNGTKLARGEAIEMYAKLKHSSCSQYVNEKGLSIDELQMLTDYARRDSVMQYASVQLEAKRRILERKVIPLGETRGKKSGK
jgi:hypothetical protein